MSESLIHQFDMSSEGLLNHCARLGIAVLDQPAQPDSAFCWLRGQPGNQAPEEAFALFELGSQAPLDAMLSRALPAGDYLPGMACLDSNTEYDLILSPAGVFECPRWFSKNPQWQAQQALIADLRNLLGERDWWVYWVQNQRTGDLLLLAIYPRGWDWQTGHWQLLDFAPLPEQCSRLSLSMISEAWIEHQELLAIQTTQAMNTRDIQEIAGRCYIKKLDFSELSWPQASLRMSGLGKRVRAALDSIWHTFLIKPVSFSGHLQQWQEILRYYLPLAQECSAWWTYLAEHLQKKQRLFDLCADQLSAPAQMHNELNILWNQTHDWRLDFPDEALEAILEDEQFSHSWKHFLGQYGHWADGGLDLAQARLQEQAPALLQSLFGNWSLEHEYLFLSRVKGKRSAHWNLLLWVQNQYDKLQNDALWALTQVRQNLLAFAADWVNQGLIKAPEDIWSLSAQDWLYLESCEARELPAVVQQGLQQAHALAHQCLQSWRHILPFEQTSLRGQGLQMGFISGQITHYQAGQINLRPDQDANRMILVCHHLDLAMLPLIEQVAAVIVSHGSSCHPTIRILLELGKVGLFALPAAAALPEGQWVRLNTDTGALSLIEAEKTE